MGAWIASALHGRLLALAAASPRREVCGLLLGFGDRIDTIAEAANVSAFPADRFEVDPAVVVRAYRAERAGHMSVVGHYHSHPGGKPIPSARDAAAAVPDGRLWLIVADGRLRAWRFGFAGFVETNLTVGD